MEMLQKQFHNISQEFFEITSISKLTLKPRKLYRINIAYKTGVEITPRTVEVANAFGLGIDKRHEFVIYDNLQLDLKPTSIVYITGDSGSGKSVLLRHLEHVMQPLNLNIEDVEVDDRKPLVETLGENLNEAIKLLSCVGLNDAFLFLRKYPELSAGQKYRYKLAKILEKTKKKEAVVFIDEFCSLLDRETAKIVAYNFQKICRKHKIGLIAATSHTDLLEDLKPDIYIYKSFGREVSVKYFKPSNFRSTCTILDKIKINEGSATDYRKLAAFHYRSHHTPSPRKIFKAVLNGKVVGVIVYSFPAPVTQGRKEAFGGKVPSIRLLNKVLSTISRVIVHPKYRSIGLGVKLVKETLPKASTPYVELIAVMAKYNPFAEKAGMKLVKIQLPSKKTLKIRDGLIKYGFKIDRISSFLYNLHVLKKLSTKQVIEIKRLFILNPHPRIMKQIFKQKIFGGKAEYERKIMDLNLENLAKLIRIVGLLCQTKAYLFWKRENG